MAIPSFEQQVQNATNNALAKQGNLTPKTSTPFYPTPTGQPLGVTAVNPSQNKKSVPTVLSKNQTASTQINPTSQNNTTTTLPPDDPSNKFNTDTGQPNPNYTYKTQGGATIQNNTITSPAPVQTNPTFAGAIGGLAGAQQANQELSNRAQQIAYNAGQQETQVGQQAAQQEGAYNTGMILPRAQGLAQNVANTAANQQTAIAQGAQTALQGTQQGLTAQGQIQGALGTAGQLTQPITGVPYGTQVINPLTGQPVSTGTSSTNGVTVDPNNPVASIPNLTQAVINGQMTIDQANSALSNNIGLTTNLRNQILTQNPNFNFTQSSSSGTTQAIGQQLKASVDTANKALDTLSSSFSSLPGVETGGIPLTNSISQWIGSQFGQAALSQYNTNLADARAQLVGVLNTSGGTPTGNEQTALSYLPDNMTKAQFDANVGTVQNPGIVRQLMNQKLTSFSGSGSQNNTGTSNTGISSGTSSGWGSLGD